jgi:hypothetical protein
MQQPNRAQAPAAPRGAYKSTSALTTNCRGLENLDTSSQSFTRVKPNHTLNTTSRNECISSLCTKYKFDYYSMTLKQWFMFLHEHNLTENEKKLIGERIRNLRGKPTRSPSPSTPPSPPPASSATPTRATTPLPPWLLKYGVPARVARPDPAADDSGIKAATADASTDGRGQQYATPAEKAFADVSVVGGAPQSQVIDHSFL